MSWLEDTGSDLEVMSFYWKWPENTVEGRNHVLGEFVLLQGSDFQEVQVTW